MQWLLRLEQAGLVLLAWVLFAPLGYAWWWMVLLFLTPDLAMLGYALGPRIGAALYNGVHHKGVAVLLYIAGLYLGVGVLQLVGTVLLAHSSFDRIFGYGLKYPDAFGHTHLGWIGKEKPGEAERAIIS
jgi:hypothetical protein